jgi:hypothetical protein
VGRRTCIGVVDGVEVAGGEVADLAVEAGLLSREEAEGEAYEVAEGAVEAVLNLVLRAEWVGGYRPMAF